MVFEILMLLFLHDTNVPYQGDAISLPDFESESRSVIEFICS